ncbi:probable RNA polymerase II nuclear localization protein SLC7A6OS [Danaus plexippus]|uniref:probable RNA polymerase II nuclear localization protein SLC7A6OS n=1 Tax=Danaus plexippus TaxID=13037 RepID=UPI002AAFE80A|nr:probable RNA polymerase II nuclear localization protein SLC7A6OS [Danaus plexippus]
MSTSTILRVKRRLDENPQDALVLVCKRMKTDKDEISPSLFVFRGSVENQENTHVKNIVPQSIPLKRSTSVSNIIQKIRKERKDVANESRYEIVNCSRGLAQCNSDNYDLVDLEKKDGKEDAQYTYDLYTPVKEDFDIAMLDNLVSIEDYRTDLVFGTYRDCDNVESDEDSEDSNAENDWRNEYPDSDPSSIDEGDMIKAVENCNIEDDLSSDEEEAQIYDEQPDLFKEDVKRFGAAYAKYKAKVLAEGDISDSQSYVHCTVKEMDDDYKDGSDDGFYYGQEEDSEQFKEQYEEDSDEKEDHDADLDEYNPD